MSPGSMCRAFFYVVGKCSYYIKALRAGGELRAKEVWLLKQPRFGARVRIAGLFILLPKMVSIYVNIAQ